MKLNYIFCVFISLFTALPMQPFDAKEQKNILRPLEVVSEIPEGIQFLQEEADKGDRESQFILALTYQKGEYVPKDMDKAIPLYIKAAEQGHVEAQKTLGILYDERLGDQAEAFKWHKMAADQGDPEALNEVGYAFERGKGVVKDVEKAFKCYKKAAKKGNIRARNNLGVCHYWGWGTKKNFNKALKCLSQASSKGWFATQVSLGYLYANRRFSGRDDSLACDYLKKALNHPKTPESVKNSIRKKLGILSHRIKAPCEMREA